MDASITTAVIAASVALTVAFLNTIVGEKYKRFREGSAVAAGLAGELSSYKGFAPMMREIIGAHVALLNSGQRAQFSLRPIDRLRDAFYEKAVGNIGSLGANLVEDVVFVYSHLNAFRVAMEVLARDMGQMSDQELRARFANVIATINSAETRGSQLVAALHQRANESFWPAWAWTGR